MCSILHMVVLSYLFTQMKQINENIPKINNKYIFQLHCEIICIPFSTLNSEQNYTPHTTFCPMSCASLRFRKLKSNKLKTCAFHFIHSINTVLCNARV